MQKPVPTESAEQRAVIAWWSFYCKTKALDERLLFAIPNGAHLAGDRVGRAIKMNRMKSEGLRVGVPDLMLAWPKPVTSSQDGGKVPIAGTFLFHGLFIEMKRRKGAKPSPEQVAYADLLRRTGFNVVIALGSDEAIRAIKGYVEA